jgi:hypothetical protein
LTQKNSVILSEAPTGAQSKDQFCFGRSTELILRQAQDDRLQMHLVNWTEAASSRTFPRSPVPREVELRGQPACQRRPSANSAVPIGVRGG